MRIDLSDLERVDGIAEALGRLFWCLIAVAFFAALLGSAGTGLLVLVLGAAAFVVRVGLEDFARARGGSSSRAPQIWRALGAGAAEPEMTIRRAPRTRARREPNRRPTKLGAR